MPYTHILFFRYKSIREAFSGLLLLWPGYVYWARGQVKQAVAAFQNAIPKLQCPENPVALGWDRIVVACEL